MDRKEVENILNESAEGIEKFKEEMNTAAENSEDVKNGKCTAEEEKMEPEFILSKGIADTCLNILRSEAVATAIADFINALKCDPAVIEPLMSLISITTVNACYDSLILYDNMLKRELEGQFNNFNRAMSDVMGDVTAHTGALEVLRKRIDDHIKESK